MFDALWMYNFCCAVYLRWNERFGQFSTSCNVEIQKKRFFFHKQALNHVCCTLDVQFLLCCLFEMKWTLWAVFHKLQRRNTEKAFFFHKQALNHVWCTLDVQFLLCCLFEMKWTLWTVFPKLQRRNTEKTSFS